MKINKITGLFKATSGVVAEATANTDYATPTLAKQLGIDINRYGFLSRAETNLSFDGTDTITLADKGSGWSYYRAGVKCTITGNKTVPCATPIVDGTLYYIYIDSTTGALVSGSAWTLNDTKVPVATLYWDSALTPKFILADERHTCKIDRAYHREHHFADGTETRAPGTIDGFTAASDTDTDKVFSLTDASIFDEDLFFDILDLAKPDGNTDVYPILYRTSANTYEWVLSDMPFKYTDVAGTYGFIEYDLNGTSTPSAANRFVNTYLFLSNSVANDETDPEVSTASTRILILQGRGSYTSVDAAKAETFAISAGFPVAEGVVVYQFTWSTTNRPDTVKGRCRYVSTQSVNGNVTTSAIALNYLHNLLLGIDGGSVGEYYHMTAAQHTIATQSATTDRSGYLTDTDWDTFNGKQAGLTFGIANTNAVKVDSDSVADDEYARFTANGLESRSASEVLSDIGANDGKVIVGINEQTGTTYTLALTDAGKLVRVSNAEAITLTVPKNSVVAFPVNTVITIEQQGAGQITVAPVDGDVTLNKYDGLKTAGQYAIVQLVKVSTDVWSCYGGVA